jgi:hypothetical protein
VISHYPDFSFRHSYIEFKFTWLIALENIRLIGFFAVDCELAIFSAANDLISSYANDALYEKLLSWVRKNAY